MRALTIKEIEELKQYDWLYIIEKNKRQDIGNYRRKMEIIGDLMNEKYLYCEFGLRKSKNYFADYGATWIAYRNKEEAECESNTIELPCKVGDIAYYVSRNRIAETKVIEISFKENNIIHIFFKDLIPLIVYENGKRTDNNDFYFDIKQAQERFFELKRRGKV